jgi:hypothetical protein
MAVRSFSIWRVMTRKAFILIERNTHFSTLADIMIFSSLMEATPPRVIVPRLLLPQLPLRALSRP